MEKSKFKKNSPPNLNIVNLYSPFPVKIVKKKDSQQTITINAGVRVRINRIPDARDINGFVISIILMSKLANCFMLPRYNTDILLLR